MSLNDITTIFQTYRNIYYGTVLDSDDPLMLGRIRVHPEHENLTALKESNQEFNEDSDDPEIGKWSRKDPLIFLPLLPYFVNQVPQKDERVMIIYYSNVRQKISDRFYIIAPFSSPTATEYEDFKSSATHLSSGIQNDRVKFPPMKNIKGKYTKMEYKGVFAEPTDIALKGRGTSDLILKNNDVILRTGKHKYDSENKLIPIINDGRAFLQLSKFDSKTVVGPEETIYKLEKTDPQIKYIVEYDVYNPGASVLTGMILIYRIEKEQAITKVSNFDYDTDLSGVTTAAPKIIQILNPLSITDFAKFISSQLITLVNKPTLLLGNLPNNTTVANTNDKIDKTQFPFYFRPSKNIRNILKNSPSTGSLNLTAYSNMQQLINQIKVTTSDVTPGYDLVLNAKFDRYIPFSPKKEKTAKITTELVENTAAILGANSLFLLSNETTIPGKNKIKFKSDKPKENPKDINYNAPNPAFKFEQEAIAQDVVPNTSSMVRGEELLELLESIVGFLVSHVHPYPLLPPSSVAYDGTSTDDLLKKMLEAYQKVLNSNIRIN